MFIIEYPREKQKSIKRWARTIEKQYPGVVLLSKKRNPANNQHQLFLDEDRLIQLCDDPSPEIETVLLLKYGHNPE